LIPLPTAQADKFISTLCTKKKSSLEIGLVFLTAKFDTALLFKSIATLMKGRAAVAEVSSAVSAVQCSAV
jgi:hypothetical protein